MSVIKKYYKHSNEGYLVMHMYSDKLKGSDTYWKNNLDKKQSKDILDGCVPLSEKKYRRQMKHLKNNSKK